MAELLIFVLATLGLVYILAESVALRPLRMLMFSHGPKAWRSFWLVFLLCPKCLGFWVGFGVAIAMWWLGGWPWWPFGPLLGVGSMTIVYSFREQELDPLVRGAMVDAAVHGEETVRPDRIRFYPADDNE